MIYADYDYYCNIYLGTSICNDDFKRLAMRASTFLDYYTQSRASKNADLEAVKMACCAIAEQYQYIDAARALAQKSLSASLNSGDSGELQSQTVGSWSRTYRSGGDSAQQAISSEKTAQDSISAIAQRYLAGTGLLYRGRGCRCVPACCDTL